MPTKTQKDQESTVSGAYRNQDSFAKALAAATAEHRSTPEAKATLQVMTHLAWRPPAGKVAWHKGTNPTMVAYAKTIGVVPDVVVAEAMELCLALLPDSPSTKELAKEVQARRLPAS